MYCGSIPSKYLPIRKNFASQPVEIPLSQSKSELNQAQPRIIGGRSTSISKYPWQVKMFFFPTLTKDHVLLFTPQKTIDFHFF